MINSQINTILKNNSKTLLNKTIFNKANSNKLANQITKQFFKTKQIKSILNTKSFCEKNQINNNTDNLEQSSTSNKNNEEFISFGFKTVKKDERQDMVNSVFANVAKR